MLKKCEIFRLMKLCCYIVIRNSAPRIFRKLGYADPPDQLFAILAWELRVVPNRRSTDYNAKIYERVRRVGFALGAGDQTLVT